MGELHFLCPLNRRVSRVTFDLSSTITIWVQDTSDWVASIRCCNKSCAYSWPRDKLCGHILRQIAIYLRDIQYDVSLLSLVLWSIKLNEHRDIDKIFELKMIKEDARGSRAIERCALCDSKWISRKSSARTIPGYPILRIQRARHKCVSHNKVL